MQEEIKIIRGKEHLPVSKDKNDCNCSKKMKSVEQKVKELIDKIEELDKKIDILEKVLKSL